nr:transglycosylase SLT domain-containing protein [Actinomycetota bacterium]
TAGSVEEAVQAWFADVDAQAREVARCESGLNPGAVSSGGRNHGLFQINDVHRSAFTSVTGQPWSSVYSAYYNAQYARYLYDDAGWQPWACRP